MPHVRYLLLVLASTLVASSLIANAAPGPSATETLRGPLLRTDGGALVQAQYITREEQQRRAQENLERHQREKDNSNSVDRSSGTATGETYGREYLERQLQGDKPRVVRPY